MQREVFSWALLLQIAVYAKVEKKLTGHLLINDYFCDSFF